MTELIIIFMNHCYIRLSLWILIISNYWILNPTCQLLYLAPSWWQSVANGLPASIDSSPALSTLKSNVFTFKREHYRLYLIRQDIYYFTVDMIFLLKSLDLTSIHSVVKCATMHVNLKQNILKMLSTLSSGNFWAHINSCFFNTCPHWKPKFKNFKSVVCIWTTRNNVSCMQLFLSHKVQI